MHGTMGKRDPLRPAIYGRFRPGAATVTPPRGWLLYGTPEAHGYVVTQDGARLLHSGST